MSSLESLVDERDNELSLELSELELKQVENTGCVIAGKPSRKFRVELLNRDNGVDNRKS